MSDLDLEEKLRREKPLLYIFREKVLEKLEERQKERLSESDTMSPKTIRSWATITPKEKLSEVVEEVTREIPLNHCPFCGAIRKTDEELSNHIIVDHFEQEPNEMGEWVMEGEG